MKFQPDPAIMLHFASNFWIGGIDESNSLKMAGGLFGSTGTDFYTGPLSTDGSATVSTEACNQYDQLFTIHEYQSLMHLEYFNCQISPDCNVFGTFPKWIHYSSIFLLLSSAWRCFLRTICLSSTIL